MFYAVGGAKPSHRPPRLEAVRRSMLRTPSPIGAVSAALGLAVAMLLTRSVASLLYGVKAADPATFAIAAVLLAGAAFSRAYSAPAANAPQLAVEQRLMCPQCLQTRLDVCDTPICSDMKADVARRLSAGESQDSIVSSFRQAYGDSILSNEQPAGLAAWVPWTVAAAGLESFVAEIGP